MRLLKLLILLLLIGAAGWIVLPTRPGGIEMKQRVSQYSREWFQKISAAFETESPPPREALPPGQEGVRREVDGNARRAEEQIRQARENHLRFKQNRGLD